MSTFVEIRTDAFVEALSASANYSRRELLHVRRPLRGIEIKDATYASLQVRKANGDPIPLVDSGALTDYSDSTVAGSKIVGGNITKEVGARSVRYSNFIIQSIVEAREEKSQIMETFGDTYIFFYGEKPRMLQVQGLLFNTLDFNWRTEFWVNYENHIRGTRLVQKNARVYLHWDDIMVEGYMLSAQAQDNADMPYHVPFQFVLFVTSHTFLSDFGSPEFPSRSSTYGLDYELTSSINGGALDPKRTLWDTLKDPARLAQAGQMVKNFGIGAAMNVIGTGAQSALGTTSGISRTGMADSTKDVARAMAGRSKDMMKEAVGLGVQSAGNYLMDAIAEYTRNQTMAIPARTKPWRSKISDNADEYLPYLPSEAVFDEGAIARTELLKKQLDSIYKVEKAALQAMKIYADPINIADPATLSSFQDFNSLSACTDTGKDIKEFAVGPQTPPSPTPPASSPPASPPATSKTAAAFDRLSEIPEGTNETTISRTVR